MNRLSIGAVLFLTASVVPAQDSYIAFDDDGNMVLSGPFELVIPRPGDAEAGGPEDASTNLLNEELTVSRAGYFGEGQFVVVQVETTNAPPGTLSDENIPVMKLAGRDYHAQKVCADISQAQLNADDDPLFEFIEEYNVQIVPAVMAMHLVAVNETGTALGNVLFVRNVPGGCDAMTQEFEEDFVADFERFIESVRVANQGR